MFGIPGFYTTALNPWDMPSKKPKPETPQEDELKRLADECKFDHRAVRPPRVVMLRVRETAIGYKGSFVAIAGKPKQGKTVWLSGMTASAFTIYDVFETKMTPEPDRPQVLYFDTEQTDDECVELFDQICDLMGKPDLPVNLVPFTCRVRKKTQIAPIIEYWIKEHPRASVVIIDGLLDLIRNFNDEEQASDLLEWIRYITETYKLLVIGIIHQSKTTGFNIGHLGSGIDRLASAVVSVEKDEQGLMILSPFAMRKKSFKPVAVMHDGNQFVLADNAMIPDKNKRKSTGPETLNIAQHRHSLNKFFREKGMMYDDIIEAARQYEGLSISMAKKYFRHWRDLDLIYQGLEKLWFQRIDTKLIPMTGNS